MELTTVIEIFGLLLGGGGIGTLLTIGYARRQARGEARQAENEATKSVQDVYQEMVADVKADREEQKEYIRELKDDRMHLRIERDELRRRLDETDNQVRVQQRQIARLGNRIDALTPLICTLTGCKKRVRNYIGLVSDDSFDVETTATKEEDGDGDNEGNDDKLKKREYGKQ